MIIRAIDPRAVEYAKRKTFVRTRINGGIAYTVKFTGPSELVIEPHSDPSKRIHLSNVREVWLGCGSNDNPKDYKNYYVGNVVLIRQNRVCHHVGISVEKFTLKTREYIVNMQSTMGNSGVPYGYLATNTRYIFQSNNCGTIGYIPKKQLKMLNGPIDLSCLEDDIRTRPMKFITVHDEYREEMNEIARLQLSNP